MNEFQIGLLSGISGTVIVAASVAFARKVAFPFLKLHLSSAPSITGTWEAYYSYENNAKPVGEVTIHQALEGIKGTASSSQRRSGDAQSYKFKFRGRSTSGFVTFTYGEESMDGYVVGVGFLRLTTNGKELKGKVTYYKQEENDIVTHDYCLRRRS